MTQTFKEDLSSAFKDWLKEVATSKLLTLFEPETESLSNVRIGQARSISTKLAKSPDDSFVRFSQRYGRHTTLAGVWMFLEKDHNKEYLVTAFGKRCGPAIDRPGQFYGLHVSHGTEHNVRFSPSCIDYFQKHIDGISNSEVLVCHNHPSNLVTNLLSQIIDLEPAPFEYRSGNNVPVQT